MKKNKEKILKYLSQLMNDNEKALFEEELINSINLKKEFDEFCFKLSDMKNEDELKVDDLYFANILPRVNQKLASTKKGWHIVNLYYLMPTAAAIVVLFLFLFNSKTSFESQYKELANEVVNNFSDKEVSERYLTELEEDQIETVMKSDSDELNVQIPSDVEINNDSYISLIGNPITEEYSIFQKLSESQIEKVFNKLNSISSQKVSK